MSSRHALAVVLGVLAVTPSSAMAGSLSFTDPCYFAGDPVAALGQGWTAGHTILITDPVVELRTSTVAGSDGSFTSTFTAPTSKKFAAVRRLTVTATDERGHETSSATFFDVQPGVDVNLDGKLTAPVRWTIAGFTGGQTIWGHWLYHGHVEKTLKMGKVPGACGLVKRTLPRLPTTPRKGAWRAQFDPKKTYSAKTPNVAVNYRVL
jgi:hypothetical protein